jgi:type II secretory pathway component GspD/PulD (secretin)
MMADATHTQGPWRVKFQASKPHTTHYTDRYWYEQWAIRGPNKSHSPVAMVAVEGLGSGPSKAVRKANAILIAAAPDLLAALEAVIEDLEGNIDGALDGGASQDWLEGANNRLDAAKAAIAKAKGA